MYYTPPYLTTQTRLPHVQKRTFFESPLLQMINDRMRMMMRMMMLMMLMLM